VCCVVSCELITYNAALNRPAFQSSLYQNSFVASLANDGDFETKYTTNGRPRCAHTLNEINPWWSVDLGRPTAVYRVDLTNVNTVHGMK